MTWQGVQDSIIISIIRANALQDGLASTCEYSVFKVKFSALLLNLNLNLLSANSLIIIALLIESMESTSWEFLTLCNYMVC